MSTAQRRRRDRTAFNPALAATEPEAQTTVTAAGVHSEDGDIARRAYELYEQRGGEHGHAWDDWFQAERELRSSARGN